MKEDIKEQEIQELHKKISDLERSLKKLRKFEKTEDSGFQSKELEIVFDHLPDATFVINCKGKVIAWNPAIEKMTGVKATQIIGKNNYEYSIPFYGTRRPILIDLIFKMEEEIRKHHYNKIRKNRTALTAETILTKNGENIHLWCKASPIYDIDGKLIGAIESIRDITDIKREEKELKESKLLYEILLDSPGDSIFLMDYDGNIVMVNESVAKRFGYTKEDMIGKNIKELLDPELVKSRRKYLRKVFETNEKVEFEDKRNGRSYHNWIYPLDEGEGLDKVAVFSQDITHQKIVENEIKASLQQKKLLLQEIHHRVKNNLQIISSLLNLQESYVKDYEALNVLQESQNRVLSMAMIHEMLYESKDLSTVNFHSYIQNLVYDLFNSYGINTSNVNLHLKVDEIHLNIETAVPSGLIINELVSNCLKYAFPEKCGNLNIDFHPRDLDEFELIIEDDGIGLPEDMNYKNTDSLGLRLVNSLVEQLDGSIELDKSHGTKFIIRFKELKYKKRI